MAKAAEIRDLPVTEIETKLDETQEELFNLRFQNATGQLDNYKRLRQLRRDVARIKTILREKELTDQTEQTELPEQKVQKSSQEVGSA